MAPAFSFGEIMATRNLPPRGDDDGQSENPDWRVQVPPSGAVQPPLFDDDEPPEESPVDRVFAVLETARTAERATVKLYRVGAKPGQYAWCDDYTIEEFEAGGFAMIREKWGPGEYEIRLYAIRPTDGRFGVLSKPRITIEAGIIAQQYQIAPPAPPAVDPAMREMLAQMANTQAAMLQALTQRPDPMANMQQMLTLAASFKQAFGSGESSKSTITEIVGAIRELKGAATELIPDKPGDDDSDNPMKLLPSVLDLVGKFAPQPVQQAQPAAPFFPPVALPPALAVNPAPAAPETVSLPVTQTAPAQSTNDAPSDDEMNALQLVLFRGYLSKLCAMSAAGNVEAAAEFALQKLPDEAFDVLEMPNWFELLAQFYPGAAQHREWLDKVRARVLQLANEG